MKQLQLYDFLEQVEYIYQAWADLEDTGLMVKDRPFKLYIPFDFGIEYVTLEFIDFHYDHAEFKIICYDNEDNAVGGAFSEYGDSLIYKSIVYCLCEVYGFWQYYNLKK